DYDDTTEGKKVCTYYKLKSIPVVLVIDPTTETGKRQLLIDVLLAPNPKILQRALAASLEDNDMNESSVNNNGATNIPTSA
ncbi:unnamed protein product, partial [Brassica rapa]